MFRWTDWNKPAPGALSFAGRAVAGILVVAFATVYVASRYAIVFDPQAQPCLPGKRVYLLDRQAREIRRGDIAVFAVRSLAGWVEQAHPAARALAPWYRDGRRIVKRVAGVPGDKVRVTLQEVRINGVMVGEGLDLAATLGRPAHSFIRNETVPSERYWVMGQTRDSFDSRYWGYAARDQLIGKAYPLF